MGGKILQTKKIVLIIGVFLAISLMISSATAVPAVNSRQLENAIDLKELKTTEDLEKPGIFSNFRNNSAAILDYLYMSFRIALILILWPFQGLWNIINYAFIENHFFQTLINDFLDGLMEIMGNDNSSYFHHTMNQINKETINI